MKKSLFIISLSCLFACGTAQELSLQESDELDSVASPVAADAVDWIFRESIGRSLEREFAVPGSLSVSLEGAELPVFDGGIVQNATVTVIAPSPRRPSVLKKFVFFVRFDVSAQQDGSKQYRLRPYGNSAVVDASLRNARARFDATYDPVTQKAVQIFLLRADLSVGFSFTGDATGTLSPVTSETSLTSHFERDFTRFTVTLRLE